MSNQMLYRDIEKKLDMQVGISVEFQHDLVPLIINEVDVVPVAVHYSDRSSNIDLFFRSDEISRIAGMISTFKPIMHGDYLIVRIPEHNISGSIKLLREFLTIKSSVPGGLYLRGGRLFSYTRFHHSELDEVSALLATSLKPGSKMRIEYLGPTPGGIQIVERINSRIPISIIAFEFTRNFEKREELLQDHIGEVHIELLTSDKYRMLLYPREPSKWGKATDAISIQDGIFTAAGSIRLLQELYEKCNEKHIPLAASISNGEGARIKLYQFIPTVFKDEFIELLFEVSGNHSDMELRLSEARRYNTDVWGNV